MGDYGMSFLVLLIVVFCRCMVPCFHRHVRLSSSQQCSLCATGLPIQGPQGIHFPGAASKANEATGNEEQTSRDQQQATRNQD